MDSEAAPSSPSKSFNGDRIQPIASLNPYQTRWAIKARVTNKSEIKTWKNERSEGRLFSVDLLDQTGGQIKATMFNEAVDQFYSRLELNKVYIIARGTLRLANKKFSVIPNDYEMTLNMDAEIEPVGEDNTIEEQKFHFITIDKLPLIPAEDNVDVIGIVKSVSQLYPVVSAKTQKQLTKRLLAITDKSLMSVELTLWGEQAEKYGEDVVNKVLAVKACKVSAYGGEKSRSLSTLFGSRVFLSPDLPEAQALQEWYSTTGKDASTETITLKNGSGRGGDPRKCFSQLKVEDLGLRTTSDSFFFINRCTPIHYRHSDDKPPWYDACPRPACNRKVSLNESTKEWFCEKCNKSFPSPSPRYILSVHAVDSTGDLWLTAFNDVAQQLLGHSAQTVSEYKSAGNTKAYENVFKNAHFKNYLMKCRAKQELGKEGDIKIRYHIIAVTPINYKQECISLLDEISGYL